MPTLDDLRDAFDALGQQAPHALSEPVGPRRHSPWLAAGLAAACTVAVAVAVPLVVADHATHRPSGTNAGTGGATESSAPTHDTMFGGPLPAPAAGHSPALAYGFAAGADGYTAITDRVTRTYQHATISKPGESIGDEYLFYQGAFDASQVEHGTPVDVAGTTGYYATLTLPDSDQPVDALAWQYDVDGDAQDADAWAVIALPSTVAAGDPSAKIDSAGDGVKSAERHVEAQVEQARLHHLESDLADRTVGTHDPLRSPVALTSSDLYVESMSDGDNGGISLDRGAAQTDGTGLGTAWTLGWSPGTLAVGDKPGSTTVDIDGATWIVYRTNGTPTGLGYVADGWGLTITPAGPTTLDEMKQFADSLRFASDPTDRSSWFDAGDALP